MVAQNRCVCAEYAEKSLELDNDVNNVNIVSCYRSYFKFTNFSVYAFIFHVIILR